MRKLIDGHNIEDRDWIFNLMAGSDLFCLKRIGGKLYVLPYYNKPMEHQCEITMKRILYLLDKGVFKGWLTNASSEMDMRSTALRECLRIYDHSLNVNLGAHFSLW